jgi:hypothetical protein
VLAAEPDALDVDVVRQVPDVLGRVERVVVARVHDARVVEDDVQPAPGVEVGNGGGDVGFFRDIAELVAKLIPP